MSFHVQGLYTNNLVLVYEFAGCFVSSIHPAISYFRMKTGNLELCLGSVITAFLFFSQVTLKVGELLLVAFGVSWITGFLAI